MARTYMMRRRAERQKETRQRIVEAAVELHGTVGPASTQVSAIAERAGVERITVYRHFPDQASLLRACREHFLALHPPPGSGWKGIEDPETRLRAGLGAAYAYYAENEAMIANVLRDAEVLPVGEGFLAFKHEVVRALSQGEDVRGPRRARLNAVLNVATDFGTWRSLVRQSGLTHDEAIDLVVRWVRCLLEP
jgi:AcrR family transcriptional regulator